LQNQIKSNQIKSNQIVTQALAAVNHQADVGSAQGKGDPSA